MCRFVFAAMIGRSNLSEQDAIKEREAYVRAFNNTMVRIWREKISMLNNPPIDTGALYDSIKGVQMTIHDNKITSVTLKQEFLEYGIYVERGTGSNTPIGNPGDIGKNNARRKKPWMIKKHYASLFNLQEFFADSLGESSCLAISNILLGKSP